MQYTVFYRRMVSGGLLPVATVSFLMDDDEQPCPAEYLLETIFNAMNDQPIGTEVSIAYKFNKSSLRSMSVGDRVSYEDGQTWVVASSGFEPLLPDWVE